MLCLYIELVGWNTKLIVYRMTSLVAAVLGRRFETSLRGLVALSKIQLQQSLRSRCHYLPLLRPSRNVLPRTKPFTPTFSSAEVSEKLMLFSEQSHDHDSSSGSSGGGQQKSGPLKLMDYKKLRWPNPINVLRNYIFAALIRISFDQEFSMSSFLAGAEQVICHSNHNFLKLVMLKNTDNEDNVDTRECKPGPFFPNPGFGFPGIPGLQKPGFRVCDHETWVWNPGFGFTLPWIEVV